MNIMQKLNITALTQVSIAVLGVIAGVYLWVAHKFTDLEAIASLASFLVLGVALSYFCPKLLSAWKTGKLSGGLLKPLYRDEHPIIFYLIFWGRNVGCTMMIGFLCIGNYWIVFNCK